MNLKYALQTTDNPNQPAPEGRHKAFQEEAIRIAEGAIREIADYDEVYGQKYPAHDTRKRIETSLGNWHHANSLQAAQHVLDTTIAALKDLNAPHLRFSLGGAVALKSRWESATGPFQSLGSQIELTNPIDAHERYHAQIKAFLPPLVEKAREGNDDAAFLIKAIEERLSRHRDVFDPDCLTIERHRISADKGTVSLRYQDSHGEAYLGIRENDDLYPTGRHGFQGGTDAYWLGIAHARFNGLGLRTRGTDEIRAELFKILEMSLGLDSPALKVLREQVEDTLSQEAPYEFENYQKLRIATATRTYSSLDVFRQDYQERPGWIEIPMGESLVCYANREHRAIVSCDSFGGECRAVCQEAYTEEGFGEALRNPVLISLQQAPGQIRQLTGSFVTDYSVPNEVIRQHVTNEVQLGLLPQLSSHPIKEVATSREPYTPQIGMTL